MTWLAVAALVATVLIRASEPAIARAAAPDVVFIVTDDQRFDTLWSMPAVQSRIAARGVTFANGFVSNPLCCPSRATLLTGEYSHTTGVYTNKSRSRYGGFEAFDDRSTIATWLQRAGYRTGLFGKYLNGYPGEYVPPGWDRWFATYENGGYYDYLATDDGTEIAYGDDPADYGTTVVGEQAAEFIRDTPADRPLFAYVAPHAPHSPATAGPEDGSAFSNLRPWRPPSHNESNVSDKPQYIQDLPKLDAAAQDSIDALRMDQYRSLLSTDRAIAGILDALADTDRLSRTLIVFTSDNGFLWGEHRWRKKTVPYEESIRVPMVARFDPLVAEPRVDDHLVVNIDLAPTAAGVAGVPAPGADGSSFLPLLRNPEAAWRSDFLIEHMSDNARGGVPTYCGVRSNSKAYIYYETREEELYDLRTDPDQLTNLMNSQGPKSTPTVQALRRRLTELCSPPPPGLELPNSFR